MVTKIYGLTNERKVHFDYHNGAKFPKSAIIMHNGVPCLPARDSHDHGTFHLVATWEEPLEDGTIVYRPADDAGIGTIYQPIEAGTEDVDILGAHYAQDLGTHWRIAHCSPKEHADFAEEAEKHTYAQLQDSINREMARLGKANDSTTRNATAPNVDALINFAAAAAADTHHRVIRATLGYFHREPHNDHKRDLAIKSIEAVMAKWTEQAKTNSHVALDIQRVNTYIPDILLELKANYNPEPRHVREKRLADAKAAAGQDPVDGYEYIYTPVRTRAAITDAADLPDPTWPFNNYPDAGRTRGDYTYYDAEPTATSFMLYVIRFQRPVAAGTQAGADIGNVAWAQGPAYRP